MNDVIKPCSQFLVGVGVLAFLPALFSAYVVASSLWIAFCHRMLFVDLRQTLCGVAWLFYVAAFIFLLTQWVRFASRRDAFPSVRGLWTVSTGYFAVTLLGIITVAGYLVWRSFQPEPLIFNDVEFRPLTFLFIPLIASLVPLLCLAFSVMLLGRAQ